MNSRKDTALADHQHALTSTLIARTVIPQFNQHGHQEMFRVSGRLVCDISDIHYCVSSVVVPVTVVLPHRIPKCTANDVEQLCAAFLNHIEDPDAFLAEMELVGCAIEKSEAQNHEKLPSFLKISVYFTLSLRRRISLL